MLSMSFALLVPIGTLCTMGPTHTTSWGMPRRERLHLTLWFDIVFSMSQKNVMSTIFIDVYFFASTTDSNEGLS